MVNDSQWITKYRETITSFLTVFNALTSLREQYDALAYGTTLTEEDFAGPNSDIELAALTSAVASIEATDGFLATGHATNLYKLIL